MFALMRGTLEKVWLLMSEAIPLSDPRVSSLGRAYIATPERRPQAIGNDSVSERYEIRQEQGHTS